MVRLPVVSGRDLVRALEKVGYVADRHAEPPYRRITVPDHKGLSKGTLRAILRQTAISADELKGLLGQPR